MYTAASEPFETDKLKVSEIHRLHYEVSGNKEGAPGMDNAILPSSIYLDFMSVRILTCLLKGGPGGGCDKQDRGFFNPDKYKIIFLDQRGAGKSIPSANLEENTTWDLVKDMERLREHLKIDKWHVFGGSWSYPDRVKTLILRGIFILRKSELRFFYQEGASHLFPEAWDEFIEPIPETERGDMVLAYHAQLNSVDDETRIKAAKAWSKWEMSTSKLYVDPAHIAEAEKDDWAKYAHHFLASLFFLFSDPSLSRCSAFARIENHYFINDGRHIPTIIVQGRYDVVCPATTAYALKKVWPEITLHIVPDAGHSSREPGTSKLLVQVGIMLPSSVSTLHTDAQSDNSRRLTSSLISDTKLYDDL
ncbi:hypothetical protein EW146_g6042 [Bondarzewia mesenterica]|uniref:Proline iminopeptidase n=1 Tax=Bondarzewia mesenterica TaxID=1095465 RepID=A0A4S4LPT2_9AGAM|nr:hypothetical protein EW146_g6042 [Bondarzewia mesenterica]